MPIDPVDSLLQSARDPDPADWEQRAEEFLESGQTFLAQDLAQKGLERHPGSDRLRISLALALARTGAADEARRVLDPLLERFQLRDVEVQRAWSAITQIVRETPARQMAEDERPPAAAADELVNLAVAMDELRGRAALNAVVDPDTLAALAEVYGLAWNEDQKEESLVLARDLYREAFKASRNPRYGVRAAGMAALLGDKRDTKSFARRALTALGDDDERLSPGERFEHAADAGLAHLLLGDRNAAQAAFQRAADAIGRRSERTVSYLSLIRLWEQHDVLSADGAADALQPPNVVVFTGHMIDRPGQEDERFPPELEAALTREIHTKLDELDVQIGYSAAACGADLLFIEAMLERDAKVNVILPCAMEDYVAASVAYAGERWEKRFRNALRLADTVNYATTEPYLGHDSLFRFGNQMLHGMAIMRAQFLETAPHLLAVWDMKEGSLPGGAADFIDQWEDIARLRIIDLDDLLSNAREAGDLKPAPLTSPTIAPPQVVEPERSIQAMLFADIVGFSKLTDASLPDYMKFLDKLSRHLNKHCDAPEAINTWGDAFFIVTDRADDLLQYAFTLQSGVETLGKAKKNGLQSDLNIRVSLHAGPVYGARDPFRKAQNFYGAHINRAARLEPVTVPGHIYATQQFVSLLTVNTTAKEQEARMAGETFTVDHVCEYVGVLSLAKNFGTQTVYHVRKKTG